jgi:hypothetical protein
MSQTNVAYGENASGRAAAVHATKELNTQRGTSGRKHFLESYAEHLAAQRNRASK